MIPGHASAAVLETPRLRLRRWRPEDREPFSALNANREVMEHFPAILPRGESDALIDRIEAHFDRHGFGFWAAEHHGTFIGFIGLAVPRFQAAFTPCVEIGWRLARPWWGQGLATEGARAALQYGFGSLGLSEIVSFTVPANLRSRRVIEKLGMFYAQEFAHPGMPDGHLLQRHVLYRLRATDTPVDSAMPHSIAIHTP
jgi:RimJ/RimL family protein N-acetyltransferase